jgi:hypothetical protein
LDWLGSKQPPVDLPVSIGFTTIRASFLAKRKILVVYIPNGTPAMI